MTTDVQNVAKNLHPLEIRILLSYKRGDELTIERVEKDRGFKPGNGNQALSWLAGKGLVSEIRRETAVFYELTDLGRQWKENGTPEERIVGLVRSRPGELRLPDIASALGLESKDVGSAFGSLSKSGALMLDERKKVIPAPDSPLGTGLEKLSALKGLLEKAAERENGLLAENDLSQTEKVAVSGVAKKRAAADAAFRQIDRETVVFGFAATEDGSVPAEALADVLRTQGITGDEIGTLTPQMLETGSWKGRAFRSYSVKTPPTRLTPGRSNPYAKFLEDVKDKLVSLGFEEFDGPVVETEFWNCDALFMPQFHSARDIHDSYSIADPAQPDGLARIKTIEEPWFSNVAAAHENGGATGSRGWNYAFDRDFTKRLVLRSQGTALSAQALPTAKIPGKYFGIARCFRYDRVDATHLPDFYQTEGIVLGDNVNLRTLLGMLEMFAVEVAGAKEVKYVPGYFPFTEPSVEIHIKHPVLGWFELGGSGIFRPEVTESLGVSVPVAAWGLGIDRMALMALGLNDLRELFTYDIENVRLRRTRH
ncbi:MAG: phenylalanine--tRNA ligase subunit alpha [Treponema sp.]|nr:phenylalanine--tRNA ligase subunit alpha [Treponema sp.]